MIHKKLLEKYYRGECSPEEVSEVLESLESEEKASDSLRLLWDETQEVRHFNEVDEDRNLRHIQPKLRIQPHTSRTRFFDYHWMKVAAILLLAFCLPYLMFTEEVQVEVQPQAVVQIIKENPAGRKSTLYLPDGSMVKLNAGSSLSYKENFQDSIREVFLIGEAFFEVAEDPAKAFIVRAGGVSTRALGTTFNVRAYRDEGAVQVVLASGKVRVSHDTAESTCLLPGQEAILDHHSQNFKKRKADMTGSLAWKDNLIIFRDASAQEVFKVLQRWYGVEFIESGKAAAGNWQFSGNFQDESLENVLLSISYVKGFSFEINDKQVLIRYPKRDER